MKFKIDKRIDNMLECIEKITAQVHNCGFWIDKTHNIVGNSRTLQIIGLHVIIYPDKL